MFVTSRFQWSDRAFRECRALQNDFLSRISLQANPPSSADSVRFYFVEWESEGNRGLINIGMNYLHAQGLPNTGGTWLSETFESDGVVYAIAAVWWD
ncbi:hypothetical protein [Allocoleopsis sp.]|uniref:hypothetical protein n=1 Tax=Allocoleopsis sp. TaxID=3088169 RepID=UPI002FD35F3C